MIIKALKLFILYFLLGLTIVAWSSVDNSMDLKAQFEYQQF